MEVARARLIVVDDDPSIRTMLRDYLEGHGFVVAEAGNGGQMREHLRACATDAVLLDVTLPGEDGLVLARWLREHHDLGLIMVTASAEVVDRVVGLEVGADDYIVKPFDPRELLARIKSVLRRVQARRPPAPAAAPVHGPDAPPAGPQQPQQQLQQQPPSGRRQRIGRCEVDLESHRMFEVDGGEVTLTPMEYQLLEAFLSNPNRVLTRDQLLLRTRNREWSPFDRSIDIRIGRLRRKIEPDPDGDPRCIRTVRNAGYMYVPNGGH